MIMEIMSNFNRRNSNIEDLSETEFEIVKSFLQGNEYENSKLISYSSDNDYWRHDFIFAYLKNGMPTSFLFFMDDYIYDVYCNENKNTAMINESKISKRFTDLSDYEKEIVWNFFSDNKDKNAIVVDRYNLRGLSRFKFAYVKDNKLYTFTYEV